MPNLSDLLDDVAEITRRPDARARAVLATNQIITDVINNARYGEDLIEVTINNPGTDLSATIALTSPNIEESVRAIAYVKTDSSELPLDPVTPKNALTFAAQGQCLTGCYYRSGSNLIVFANKGWSHIRLGYYQVLQRLSETAGNDTHWLLDQEYQMIFTGVIARVFKATGDDTSGQEYEQLFRDMRSTFRRMRSEQEDN